MLVSLRNPQPLLALVSLPTHVSMLTSPPLNDMPDPPFALTTLSRNLQTLAPRFGTSAQTWMPLPAKLWT